MKRCFAIWICILLISNTLALPVAATQTENEQIIVSQTIEHINDECYFIETIYVPSIQPYSGSKTGTKVAECVSSGTTIYTLSVTGTFTYDGTTADATSAKCAIATHVSNATISSRNAYTSGASAIATGSVVYYGITLQKTVTLTCDKNGNLS